jgi:hypothetical protein
MGKTITNIYCIGSIPVAAASIHLYDFFKKKDDGVKLEENQIVKNLKTKIFKKDITDIKNTNYLNISSFADGAYPYYVLLDENKKVKKLFFELNNSCGWGSSMFSKQVRKERLKSERLARPQTPPGYQMDMTVAPAMSVNFGSRNRKTYISWTWFNEIDGEAFEAQKKSVRKKILDLNITSEFIVFEDKGDLDFLDEGKDIKKKYKELIKKEKFYGVDDGLHFDEVYFPVKNKKYPVYVHHVFKTTKEEEYDLESENLANEISKPIYPIICIEDIEGCYLTKDEDAKLIFVRENKKKLSDNLLNQIKKKNKNIILCQLDLENFKSLKFIEMLKFKIDTLEMHGLINITDWSPLLNLKNIKSIKFVNCNLDMEDRGKNSCKSTIKKLDKIKIIVDDEEVDLNSKKHEIKTEDGYHYVGEFDSENNCINGKGTLILPDGTKYVGQFKNDKYHGFGTLIIPSGSKYVGEFKDGMEHGQATFYSCDGWVYEGPFRNNKYHGKGTVTMNGKTVEVEYKDGVEIEK